MQESWKFKWEHPTQELAEREIGTLLKHTLTQQYKELGIFLSYYFRSEGAVVEDVEVTDILQFDSSYTGSLEVQFKLIFYNACLNIHEKEKDRMVLEFTIDPSSQQLILTGPFVPERGMDDI